MIISEIRQENIIYFNLHAEQVMQCTYPKDGKFELKNQGVFVETVSKEIFTKIKKRIADITQNITENITIVLDFKNLYNCTKNYAREFDKDFVKNSSISIILHNVTISIVNKLELHKYTDEDKEFYEILNLTKKNDFSTVKYNIAFYKEFDKKLNIISEVKEEYILNDSSSIYLNKYIDVKKIISEHRAFMIYSIYKLAMKFINSGKSGTHNWTVEREKNDYILVCQNLNTSYVGTILSDFLKVDMIIIDHIGPRNKIYKRIGERFRRRQQYVVLSDVYCLGTEYKITKGIIEYSGGVCLGNASLIKVNTLKEEDKDRDSCSLYNISRDNNPIGYKFKTILENIDE